jgi:hypothetical protein
MLFLGRFLSSQTSHTGFVIPTLDIVGPTRTGGSCDTFKTTKQHFLHSADQLIGDGYTNNSENNYIFFLRYYRGQHHCLPLNVKKCSELQTPSGPGNQNFGMQNIVAGGLLQKQGPRYSTELNYVPPSSMHYLTLQTKTGVEFLQHHWQ